MEGGWGADSTASSPPQPYTHFTKHPRKSTTLSSAHITTAGMTIDSSQCSQAKGLK